ncbi:MAG: OprD family outer membrane porin [Xanthobacter sp.]
MRRKVASACITGLLGLSVLDLAPAWGEALQDQGTTAQDMLEVAAHDFISGSSLTVLNRLVLEHLDYLRGDTFKISKLGMRHGKTLESGYGLMLNFKSGYTPGLVGLGVDAFLYGAFNLNQDELLNGRERFIPTDENGSAMGSFGRGGVAGKLRISKTEFRFGDMRTKNPVLSSSDSRLLPETNRGWMVTSTDLEGLSLQLGRFTGWGDRVGISNDAPMTASYSGMTGPSVSFIGGTWRGQVEGFAATAYLSHFEDNWDTWYIGADYEKELADEQALALNFNLYRNTSTGIARSGSINTVAASFMGTYMHGPHLLAVSVQKVTGDTPFDYVNNGSIWLTNSVQLSDFNGPGEFSWQVRYELDLSGSILPGLVVGAAFTRGTGINGTHVPVTSPYFEYYGRDGQHWELDLLARYMVPEGWAEGLVLFGRFGLHRANTDAGAPNMNQIRFGAEMPLEIL